MLLLWLGAIVFGLVGAAFAYLVRQLLARPNLPEFDSTWINRFSVRRYKALERLVSDRDERFLSSHPACQPGMVRRLRRERRRILRTFLRGIRRDFERLCLAGRLIALYSPVDRPDLTRDLVRLQIVFQFALARVWLQVYLAGWGLGSVDIRRVVGPVVALHAQLGTVSVPA
jgi:hypothetical protein